MLRHIGRVFVIMLALCPAGWVRAQTAEEARALYESYLNKQQSAPRPREISRYRSPDIFADSQASKLSTLDSLQPSLDQTGTFPAEPTDSQQDTLELFGYAMFAGTATSFAPPLVSTAPPDYRLGPGDNLLVNLWGGVDLELNLTISREGTVFIPKVGEIICNGLTLAEMQGRLKHRLSQTYSNFQLSLTLGKIRTINVYVYGEVKQPGGYALSSLSSLFNALYAAHGPNERGSLRRVRLLRSGKVIAEVDLYTFLLHGDISGNLKLESEDVVFVPLADGLVTVSGEVRRPAIYELSGGEKITDVIALAGGTAPNAYVSRIMVERIGPADHHEIIDLDLTGVDNDSAEMAMRGGDVVTVFATDQMRENVVWLTGHVKHPGVFQLQDRPKVSDLIFDGQQLYDDSYLERADLIRTGPDSRQEILPVDLRAVVAGRDSANLSLQNKDSLIVYADSEVTRKRFVAISGEVERPGQYQLYENMRLSDLIFRAGTLKRNAFLLSAEIARLTTEGKRELTYVNLRQLLDDHDSSVDVQLAEDDQVYIRKIPGWQADRIVTIEGEVRFPGPYSLSYRQETLLELIQRAGGLTENAFPKGAVFLRPAIAEDLNRKNVEGIIRNSAELEEDTTGRIKSDLVLRVDHERMCRIVMDLEALLQSRKKERDVVLRPGDKIYVPMIPSGVQVMGAVASTGTIGFSDGQKPNYYISKAGGFVRSSDVNQTRIVKADGRVLSWHRAKHKHVELGDAIIVPTRVSKEHDWWKILSSTAGLLGGLATTVFVIDKL